MTSKFTQFRCASKDAAVTGQARFDLRDRDIQNALQVAGTSRYGFVTYLTTDELAAAVCVKPQSIRKRYSQEGSYFGLVPIKLANRRLMFDPAAVEQFLRGEVL